MPLAMIYNLLILLCSFFVHHVSALGVTITTPAPGASFPSGPYTVNWTYVDGDSQTGNLMYYNLQLVVGGLNSDNSQVVQNFSGPGLVSEGTTGGVIDANAAQSIQNGFYFMMTSNTSTGVQVVNYSGRFTLLDMNGTTDAAYLQGANSAVGDQAVPQAQVIELPRSSNSATASPSSSTTHVVTVTASASSSPTPFTNADQSDQAAGAPLGVIIGVTVGVFSLAVVITCVVFWVVFRCRRRKQRDRENLSKEDVAILDKPELPSPPPPGDVQSPIEMASGHRQSLNSHEKAVEMAEPEAIYELEGDWSPWEAGPGRRSKAWDAIL